MIDDSLPADVCLGYPELITLPACLHSGNVYSLDICTTYPELLTTPSCTGTGWSLELQTKVHAKVRNQIANLRLTFV